MTSIFFCYLFGLIGLTKVKWFVIFILMCNYLHLCMYGEKKTLLEPLINLDMMSYLKKEASALI